MPQYVVSLDNSFYLENRFARITLNLPQVDGATYSAATGKLLQLWRCVIACQTRWSLLLSCDTRPRLAGRQFLLMGLSICLTVAVVGLIRIAERRSPANSPAFFTRHGSSIAVAGYELGRPLALPECPTTGETGMTRTYAYAISARCFEHATQTDIGKPLSKKEAVLVEQLDIAKQYGAANWARPICIGVVDGNVEALEVSINAKSVRQQTAVSKYKCNSFSQDALHGKNIRTSE
ncbi:hypothetical protein [Paraburkholderia sp. BCC1886]|uniref:hypothetical protein n=1 Tax=Paraburkholderia sp. BCC1886 TaxID=2562670 RepID=UPI001182C0CE|nr:hypothetical protein [Paraburkholderia sp. BCC1886]